MSRYDSSPSIVVASKASNYGVDAAVLHTIPDGSEKAISHVARSLTTTERNYRQIGKEALPIIFAVKQSHKLTYDQHLA